MRARLKHDRRKARAYGFRKQTSSLGLFTHFRHRQGKDNYHRIFNQLLTSLIKAGVVKAEVVAVDSQRAQCY